MTSYNVMLMITSVTLYHDYVAAFFPIYNGHISHLFILHVLYLLFMNLRILIMKNS